METKKIKLTQERMNGKHVSTVYNFPVYFKK